MNIKVNRTYIISEDCLNEIFDNGDYWDYGEITEESSKKDILNEVMNELSEEHFFEDKCEIIQSVDSTSEKELIDYIQQMRVKYNSKKRSEKRKEWYRTQIRYYQTLLKNEEEG